MGLPRHIEKEGGGGKGLGEDSTKLLDGIQKFRNPNQSIVLLCNFCLVAYSERKIFIRYTYIQTKKRSSNFISTIFLKRNCYSI